MYVLICTASRLYLKRWSHTIFNSYVVGMEHETKDLHSELSLWTCSCASRMVKFPKKEQDNGLQANWYYKIISWKPVHLKSPIGFKYPYLYWLGQLGARVFTMPNNSNLIFESYYSDWGKSRVRCPPTPKPTKNQPLSHHISPSIMVGWGRFKFQVAILCTCVVISYKTYVPNEQNICSSLGRRCLVKHRKPWLNCVCGHLLYFYVN